MEALPILKERDVQLFEKGTWSNFKDQLVVEEHLQIILNGEILVSSACSPEYTRELAVGYLVSEGFITSSQDLASVKAPHPLRVEVETTKPVDLSAPRQINTCMGRGSGLQVEPIVSPNDNLLWSPAHLLQLIAELDASSLTFKKTGGVHSAALAGPQGTIVRFEDIGRHNAVDKVIGYACLQHIPLHDKCLLLSGRIASEILLKIARAGFPMIVSRSAPTYKAVDRAEELGITVVGFARGQRFNLYCHGQRIAREQ
ncbi:MAG TPA: formate dehydrogenase accessory sulfurtransferase FdhD [Syntrophomonadaceae bacterium]|nr:formate dehydrogenase accessory sulfurtransferase FdhD [Syntrophomonadaceae bacterium]HQA06792.1 formate dehydrogenase accessory sulfurtransferase FdhD [Syntrophomonadaceae bacterium]HQE22873.1 formate dehydrogenase accessory sulfurtransferase FdhD [Syntrophomonadaceae bacterium]